MQLPLFIDFESSSLEEDSYPIACAWTLPDGSVKSVLIIPEDDWTDWDVCTEDVHGLSRDQLFMNGHTAKDIVIEMNNDLDGETLYCDALYYDQQWLDRLFDAVDESPSFTLAAFNELVPDRDQFEVEDARRQLQEERGLQVHQADDDVRLLQLLYLQLTGELRNGETPMVEVDEESEGYSANGDNGQDLNGF